MLAGLLVEYVMPRTSSAEKCLHGWRCQLVICVDLEVVLELVKWHTEPIRSPIEAAVRVGIFQSVQRVVPGVGIACARHGREGLLDWVDAR